MTARNVIESILLNLGTADLERLIAEALEQRMNCEAIIRNRNYQDRPGQRQEDFVAAKEMAGLFIDAARAVTIDREKFRCRQV